MCRVWGSAEKYVWSGCCRGFYSGERPRHLCFPRSRTAAATTTAYIVEYRERTEQLQLRVAAATPVRERACPCLLLGSTRCQDALGTLWEPSLYPSLFSFVCCQTILSFLLRSSNSAHTKHSPGEYSVYKQSFALLRGLYYYSLSWAARVREKDEGWKDRERERKERFACSDLFFAFPCHIHLYLPGIYYIGPSTCSILLPQLRSSVYTVHPLILL